MQRSPTRERHPPPLGPPTRRGVALLAGVALALVAAQARRPAASPATLEELAERLQAVEERFAREDLAARIDRIELEIVRLRDLVSSGSRRRVEDPSQASDRQRLGRLERQVRELAGGYGGQRLDSRLSTLESRMNGLEGELRSLRHRR
jgi:hypothetical protein